MKKAFAYYPDIPGHFKSYAEFLELISEKAFFPTCKFSILQFYGADSYAVIDGDGPNLLLAIPALARAFLGKTTVFFSVRTEVFLEKSLLGSLRRSLIRMIRFTPNLEFISIHKDNIEVEASIPANYIYDPQYWDLPYLKISMQCPPEARNIFFENKRKHSKQIYWCVDL